MKLKLKTKKKLPEKDSYSELLDSFISKIGKNGNKTKEYFKWFKLEEKLPDDSEEQILVKYVNRSIEVLPSFLVLQHWVRGVYFAPGTYFGIEWMRIKK
jgi:hypothetical protein